MYRIFFFLILLYVDSRDTTVRVWRVGGIEEERSLRGHRASVTSVAFLPGELAATVLAKLEVDTYVIFHIAIYSKYI